MSFTVEYNDDNLERLFSHPFESVAPEMLNEAAPILVESTKQALRSVIRHSGESELVNSIKATKPKKTKTDAYILNVTPKGYSKNTFTRGKRKYPVTNAAKAVWLEYGVAGRQAPRPWRDKATSSKASEIESVMQEKYNRIIGAE